MLQGHGFGRPRWKRPGNETHRGLGPAALFGSPMSNLSVRCNVRCEVDRKRFEKPCITGLHCIREAKVRSRLMESITTVRPFATSSLSLPINSYIYCIKAAGGTLAAISSDDSLRVFDPVTLQVQADRVFENAHTGLVCLEKVDVEAGSVFTAGRDGYVRCWDLRSGKRTVELKDGRCILMSAMILMANEFEQKNLPRFCLLLLHLVEPQ